MGRLLSQIYGRRDRRVPFLRDVVHLKHDRRVGAVLYPLSDRVGVAWAGT